MGRFHYEVCDAEADRAEIDELFFDLREELYLPDREAVLQMTDTIFKHGGVLGAYDKGEMVAAIGYFLGDPADYFMDKSICFLYVAAMRPEYRTTTLFYKGLLYALGQISLMGCTEIRMQAEETNPVTNRLYARFAKPIGRSKTLRGHSVIMYSGSIEEAVARLPSRRKLQKVA